MVHECTGTCRSYRIFQTISELFDDAQHYEDTGTLYIPIRLKTGVERDRVVDEAVEQMKWISETLLENFSDGG